MNFAPPYRLEDFNNKFNSSELFGKTVNLGSEIATCKFERIDPLKRLTGNDLIMAQKKFKHPFQFQNIALLIFAMNELPDFGQLKDPGSIISRLVMLPFPRSFVGDEKDDSLIEKILTEPGKEFIINFAIEGLQRFIQNGNKFSPCKAADRLLQEFSLQQNSFLSFAEWHLRKDPKAKTATAEIKKSYHQFCEELQVPEVHVTIWGELLHSKYGCTPCRGISYDGSTNVRGYSGIELV